MGARVLAPLALAATVAAIYVLAHRELATKHDAKPAARAPHQVTNASPRPRHAAPRRFYVVKSGDTLSNISLRTGVSVQAIEALNPGVDPNALQTGYRLRLR